MRDLIVIGGGASGSAAAPMAMERGLDVVLIEGKEQPNRLAYEAALADALAGRPLTNAPRERRADGFQRAVRRAGELAAAATDARGRLLSRRGVPRIVGRVSIPGEPGLVLIHSAQGTEEELRAKCVLVATGSRRVVPGLDGRVVESGDRRRLVDELAPPASAIVVGGGRDGVALAGLLACAGTAVTLVEAASRVLPAADADVSSACARALESAGTRLVLSSRVESATWDVPAGARIVARLASGDELALEAERLYLAGARVPHLDCLAPELAAGLTLPLPAQDYRLVGDWLFAAGSATGRPSWPEVARREGRAAVSQIAGIPEHVPHRDVPRFVSGIGGGGWVGRTEVECVEAGLAIVVGRARLPGSGRIPPGFVKVVADGGSHRLLGVHVAGSQGREAVVVAAALIECGAGRSELAAMAFGGGSAAEALAEAAASAAPP